MTGTSDVQTNITAACDLIAEAAARGCELVALPENVTFMGVETAKPQAAESADGPSATAIAEAARRHRIFVLMGSMVEASDDPQRPYNSSLLFDPAGHRIAHYRKVHLFDVEVAGDRSYKESDFVTAGQPEPVVANVNGVLVGLTICFDLRFPWIYQSLRRAGAEALFVPAAFTVPTGADHWDTLLRARAIETQSVVLAPGQYGTHDTGRRTYGRSIIVDPWGTVLARVADGGRLAIASIDFDRVPRLRASMPMKTREPGR